MAKTKKTFANIIMFDRDGKQQVLESLLCVPACGFESDHIESTQCDTKENNPWNEWRLKNLWKEFFSIFLI